MSTVWETVRVFISSTFRDMHAERDWLVKVVFPALRQRLENYRVYLIDIDLRWGLTREQPENDEVLEACLRQIDECRPFFVGLLGERYGWVPRRFPSEVLQRFGWVRQETGKSLTELEILHGVLNDPRMRGQAFFYFRDPQALQTLPPALRNEVYADTDPESVRKLRELKEAIRHSGYPVMDSYPARWDPGPKDGTSQSRGRLVGLESFGNRVRDQLWQAIQTKLQLPDTPPSMVLAKADPLAEEADHHRRFMESLLRFHVGRQEALHSLVELVEKDRQTPCLVYGPEGCGKSSLLARLAELCQTRHPDWVVVTHFVGASSNSADLLQMLTRLCLVLQHQFGWSGKLPVKKGLLADAFRELIRRVPAEQRLLLVLAGLDQLDEYRADTRLSWFPWDLPPQVKVVGACLGEGDDELAVTAGILQRPNHGWWLMTQGLTQAERREMVRRVPSLYAKCLTERQARRLVDNPAAGNPLHLMVVLEELRVFGEYQRLDALIRSLPRRRRNPLPNWVRRRLLHASEPYDPYPAFPMFRRVIERLLADFEPPLVRLILRTIAVAQLGLSERDLRELVGGQLATASSSEVAVDQMYPILRQLRPYLIYRGELITFASRSMFKAVRTSTDARVGRPDSGRVF